VDSERQKELKADGLYWLHQYVLNAFEKYHHPISSSTLGYEIYTDGKLSVKLNNPNGPPRHSYLKGMTREKIQRLVTRTLDSLCKSGAFICENGLYRKASVLERLAAIPDNTSD